MTCSPFPGMDPFLEKATKWSSVHTRLINAISDQLADAVSPNFYVEVVPAPTLAHSDQKWVDECLRHWTMS